MNDSGTPRLEPVAELRVDAVLKAWNNRDVLAHPLSGPKTGGAAEFAAAVHRRASARRLDVRGAQKPATRGVHSGIDATAAVWFIASLPAFLAMQSRNGLAIGVAAVGLVIAAVWEQLCTRADRV